MILQADALSDSNSIIRLLLIISLIILLFGGLVAIMTYLLLRVVQAEASDMAQLLFANLTRTWTDILRAFRGPMILR